MDARTWIELASLVFVLVFNAGAGIWKLSRVEIALRQAIQESRNETDDRIERQGREFGETARAALEHIRKVEADGLEKVREVELFIRDTFMRRDSFYQVQTSMEASMKALWDAIDKRLERMEAKIDSKT